MRDFQTLELRDHFRSFWRADPDCPVWLWAENNVVLSPMESADMAGPFSAAVTPFIKEPLECFRDGSVHDITLVFGTQIVKTLMIMLGVAWWLEHHAGRCIWVMDTESNARSFSETRWQPLIRDCDALAAMIPADKDEFKKLQQKLGQSLIHFIGSNSPGNLASRPADLVVMDEVDKFAVTTSREANAVDLVEQRTKSRANTKVLKTSSPTTEEGLIWKSWLHGDQRQYFVPCPHCGEFIVLEFENVKWDQAAKSSKGWNYEKVRGSARYICQQCSGEIHDGHKTAMLRGGEWRPTNPHAAPGVRSYQLTSLYSPWAKTTFGALAVEFLKHKARYDMKGWDNGYMARPTTETAKALDWEELAARREPYIGTPPEVALVTAFCDVQDSWLEFGAIGWGQGKENWLLEHEVIHGDPSRPAVWNDLAQILDRKRDLPLDWTFIDYGGHHGQAAIDFVKRMASRRVYLHRGSNQINTPVNGKTTWTKKPRTRLFETGVGNAKRIIFAMLDIDQPGPGRCHFRAEMDDESFKQLCAEELRTKYQHGTPVEYWYQTRPRNEMLDIYVGCYAGLCRINDGLVRRRMAEMLERVKKRHPKMEEEPKPEAPPISQATEKKKRRNGRRTPRGWVTGM
jgi:phage terminase large subunit GpA-like protein